MLAFQIVLSTRKMIDAVDDSSCISCAKLQEALEASKKEHSLTLRMVKEKIISTDELIKKYQQKCFESDKNLQQASDFTLKLEAAQMKIEALQSQLERSLHSTEPLRKNVARLHREKSLADSSILELREKAQGLETMNVELMNTAKVKDAQECAWRLEKQVQAHEVQKQKKSLEKSEKMITKLQDKLKNEKEHNKGTNKSLTQANRKAAKLEQELQKSKDEIKSMKLDAKLARSLEDDICGIDRTSLSRQKRKTRQPAQPYKEPKQASPPVSSPNQHMAHIIQELEELSDVGPVLSPLPPSPDRGALESSSSSEESDSDGGREDDGTSSDDGGSDSSLGDLADMIIGENTELGELVASPEGTAIDIPICDEEIVNTTSGDSTRINTNADDDETPTVQPQNDFSASESMALPNCTIQTNPEDEISEHERGLNKIDEASKVTESHSFRGLVQGGSLNKIDEASKVTESHSFRGLVQGGSLNKIDEASKVTENHYFSEARNKEGDNEIIKAVGLLNTSKFAAIPPSPQRKGRRRVTSPKPCVMTRSRTKAMKHSVSSEDNSSSEKETWKDLNSTQDQGSESSDAELDRDISARKIRKLDGGSVPFVATADTKESNNVGRNDREVRVEGETRDIDATRQHRNIRELDHSAASLSSIEKEATNDGNPSVLTVDAAVNTQELGYSVASLSSIAKKATDDGISSVLAVDAATNIRELDHSAASLSSIAKKATNDGNPSVLAVDAAVNTQELGHSVASLSSIEKEVTNDGHPSVLSLPLDSVMNIREHGHSAALPSSIEKEVTNDGNTSVLTLDAAANIREIGLSVASLSSIETEVANDDIPSILALDAATNNNKPAKLDIEGEQESGIKNSNLVNTPMKQSDDFDEIASSELSNNNTDSALAFNDNAAVTNTLNEQTLPQGDNSTVISENTSASQLQTKVTELEQKEETLEENNNEILEDVEDAPETTLEENNNEILEDVEDVEDVEEAPEQLELDSVSALSIVVDTDTSEQNKLSLQETCVVSSCTLERETSSLSELSTTCVRDENERRLSEQVRSFSENEIKDDPVSCEELPARTMGSCSIKHPEVQTSRESSSPGAFDVNHADIPTTTATATTINSLAKKYKGDSSEDSNLAVGEGVLLCSSSMLSSSTTFSKGQTSGVGSSTADIKHATIPTTTATATTIHSLAKKYKGDSSEDSNLAVGEGVLCSSSMLSSSTKFSKGQTSGVGSSTVDIKHAAIPTMTVTTTHSLAKKYKGESSEDCNLAMGEGVLLCSSSMLISSSTKTSTGKTSGIGSLTVDVDLAATETTTTVPSTRGSFDQMHRDGTSGDALKESATLDASNDATQKCSVKEKRAENSKTENSQKGTFEITAGRSTFQEGRTNFEKGSAAVQEVKESLTSNFESDILTLTNASKESGGHTGPSLLLLDVEIEPKGSDPLQLPLSPNKTDSPDNASVKLGMKDDSSIQALISDLGDVIGDLFPVLSPLPPSPCPSDDEARPASPVRDFMDDFPPLSPLPPSPGCLVDEVCPDSSIAFNDFSNQTQKCASNTRMVGKTTQPQQRYPTSNYTELSSKNIIRTSSRGNTSGNITNSDDRDVFGKNRFVKSKTGMLELTPARENKSLKRSLQQSAPESTKYVNTVSQCKKMKAQQKVNQKQESSTLIEGLKAPVASVNSVSHDGPMMSNQLKQPSKNIGIYEGQVMEKQLKQPSKIIDTNIGPMMGKRLKRPSRNVASEGSIMKTNNVNNSTKATEPKDSKYRPLGVRPQFQTEVKYAFKCLIRLYEDNVELNVVVSRLTSKKCLSSCTPLASAIIQFLKQRQDDVMPRILNQLEEFQSNEGPLDWKPVKTGFETLLLDLLTQLCGNDTIFGNFFPQLVTLCSRSLITACSNLRDDNFKGALSLCRVLTGLCRLQEDLGCIRVVCYDVMRSLYSYQDAALELVVAMVTVWPEVLKTSDYEDDKQSLLVGTLKTVLLNWVESWTLDLGNILRVLCSWGSEPGTQETVKDLELQLIKRLLDENVADVCIGEDGTLVADIHSFELIKSLELLSCALGWQWTVNELIINNIWKILERWADEESNVKMQQATLTNHKQNVIVEADQSTSTRKKSTCGCRTFSWGSDGIADTLSGEGVREICSHCGKLTGGRLAESQILLCIRLLGALCRIAIENHQSAVTELTDVLCGLIEETSSNSKVTHAIHLAAAVSLLDLSPWQPERVVTVLSKWLTGLQQSGSLQAPTCVTQGLVCLKSIVKFRQTDS